MTAGGAPRPVAVPPRDRSVTEPPGAPGAPGSAEGPSGGPSEDADGEVLGEGEAGAPEAPETAGAGGTEASPAARSARSGAPAPPSARDPTRAVATTVVGTRRAATPAAAMSTRVRRESRAHGERPPPGAETTTGGSGSGAGRGAGAVSGADTGAGAGAAGTGTAAPATAAPAGRRRAASATIHRRCTSTSSSPTAPHSRANRSTGAYSLGTASPLQYRWSVDVLTCSLPASTP